MKFDFEIPDWTAWILLVYLCFILSIDILQVVIWLIIGEWPNHG